MVTDNEFAGPYYDGTNFPQWEREIRIYLGERGLLEFLEGEAEEPVDPFKHPELFPLADMDLAKPPKIFTASHVERTAQSDYTMENFSTLSPETREGMMQRLSTTNDLSILHSLDQEYKRQMKQYISDSMKARAAILSTINRNFFGRFKIEVDDPPHKVYFKLKDCFLRYIKAHGHSLVNQFRTMKRGDQESVERFHNRIMRGAQIIEYFQPDSVTESEKLRVFFLGVIAQYPDTVRHLEQQIEDGIDITMLDALYQLQKDEAHMAEGRTRVQSSTKSASKGRKQSEGFEQALVGGQQHDGGHKGRPSKGTMRQPRTQEKGKADQIEEVKCYNCEGFGHISVQCPSPLRRKVSCCST